MTKKLAIIISVLAAIVFTDILFCLGVFGASISETFITVSLVILKWTAIAFGYFLCVAVPCRIIFLANKGKEVQKEIDKEEEYRKVTEQNNELIRKIEESYYNPKDTF